MKMYLPFGDWSEDGHCRSNKVLIEAPSMEHLLNAQIKIKEKYGKDFFNEYANQYEEPHFSTNIYKALMDTNYPFETFRYLVNDIYLDEHYNAFDEIIKNEDEISARYNLHTDISVNLETVIDTFIYLLNAFGANIIKLEEKEGIPTICNWTCQGFEDVGYGCW